MKDKRIIIAVDGFSSTGKSTFARKIAAMMDYLYIDTGALYRAVTLDALENGVIESVSPFRYDSRKLAGRLGCISVDFRKGDTPDKFITVLNGKDVESEIRGMRVSEVVSQVSGIKEVRDFVDARLKKFGENKCIVMDGRDIGTSVFPDAELKIFMVADVMTRARRRRSEMREKGNTETTFEEVLENLRNRDRMDQERKVSPLRKADDAIVLDNSSMTLEDQMRWIESIIR